MNAQAVPRQQVIDSGAGKFKTAVPSIVHTILPEGGDGSKHQELQTAFGGCMVVCWTFEEVDACIQQRLPHMANICASTDSAKAMIFPYILMYLFGGTFIRSSVGVATDPTALYVHHPSALLFFFLASPDDLAAAQLTFGICEKLVAAAPRIEAMHTLLDVMVRQATSGEYVSDVHAGIINQFVRAAMQGSKSDTVKLLSDKYLHDPSGVHNLLISPASSANAADSELRQFMREFLSKASSVHVMHGAPVYADVRDMASASGAKFNDGGRIDVLVLDTEFDPASPVDACMDVALLLHSRFKDLEESAHVLLRDGCGSIARTQLELHEAREVRKIDEFTAWRLRGT